MSRRSTSSGPRLPSHAELEQLYRLYCIDRGVRFRTDLYNHLCDYVDVYRRWSAASSWSTTGITTRGQTARQLWDDAHDVATIRKRGMSMRRWDEHLAAMGVLAVDEHTIGTGKCRGIRWSVLGEWRARLDALSARSSAGFSAGSAKVRRRRESRQEAAERRIRPGCRRSGRAGVGRYERRRFFSSSQSVQPGGSGGSDPRRGPSPRSPDRQDAREGPGGASGAAAAVRAAIRAGLSSAGLDAIERCCPPAERAALGALRTAAVGGAGLGAVRRAAEQQAVSAVVAALAAWSVAYEGKNPFLSRQAREQLERSAAQFDRWTPRVPGDQRPAAVWLVDQIAAGRELELLGGAEPARTLRVFVLDLKHEARLRRRQARGAPAPRPWRSRGVPHSW